MSYQVLARKFRPQSFKDVIGQEAVITTLRHALAKQRLAQAYLFCGCRGTGKTTLARLFAKALNCAALKEGEPCNCCSSCIDITASNSLDVLEIDGASHRGIEDIRQINESVNFAATSGKYKIYIIDEVHMLTKEAFNALLKTLEEPPAHVKFFFATTEPHKLPATILSRCQRFNLMRLSEEQIIDSLQAIAQNLQIEIQEQSALELVARLAEGSLRDAQSLFDQLIVFSEGKITEQAARASLGLPDWEILQRLDRAKGKYEEAFAITEQLFTSGKSLSYFLEELARHFRQHLLAKKGLATSIGAEAYREEQLLDLMELLQEAMTAIKTAPSERVYVEMILLKILRSHERFALTELVQRLEQLEQRLQQPTVKPESLKAPQQQVMTETPKKVVEPVRPQPKAPEVAKPPATAVKLEADTKGRLDTLMRFAAKELNGTLKLD